MALTLAQARSRVRLLIDDVAGKLVDDVEIDDALATAQEEVWLLVVGSGSTLAALETQVQVQFGVADLSVLNPRPLRILNVAEMVGTFSRRTIAPAPLREALSDYTSSMTLRLQYVPAVNFPEGDDSEFIWGDPRLPSKVLDDLMVAIAAAALKITEAEVNTALERRKDELRVSALSQLNQPGWSVMPLVHRRRRGGGRSRSLYYAMTGPYRLQLLY